MSEVMFETNQLSQLSQSDPQIIRSSFENQSIHITTVRLNGDNFL